MAFVFNRCRCCYCAFSFFFFYIFTLSTFLQSNKVPTCLSKWLKHCTSLISWHLMDICSQSRNMHSVSKTTTPSTVSRRHIIGHPTAGNLKILTMLSIYASAPCRTKLD
uniref:Uncharacterized protein n=1 Tax=Cacopsylla melanoneura TaxID=428564 RepID=A0A8D8PN20_9HEMI